jgi:CBS domain-containing protein
VTLSPIGGIASMERMPEKPTQELLVAIAGPLVNVVIALLLVIGFGITASGVTGIDFDTATLAERLLIVNIVLVLFNMVPAFPMDGGRVLRALLAMRMGAPRATALAARIGQGFAFLFVLLGLFYNPILMFVGVFIYLAAASEEQTAAFTGFASRLKVRDAMEPSPILLAADDPLSKAVDALLASAQKEFPVVDDQGRVAGLLDRDSMILGLRDQGATAAVGTAMRPSEPLFLDQPLVDAFTRMRNTGARAEVVLDAAGHVVGILTQENVTEMMMVENARPGWRFGRRAFENFVLYHTRDFSNRSLSLIQHVVR